MVSTRRSTLLMDQAPSSPPAADETENNGSNERANDADNVDEDTEIVVDMMNDVAKAQNSSRKRGRPSKGTDSSPNKRRAIATPSSVTNTAGGAGSSVSRAGLQKRDRNSTISRHSVNRRDVFAMSNEENHEPPSAAHTIGQTTLPPPKKTRSLRPAKKTNESPFKGKGIVDVKTNGKVNLDDTPAIRSTAQRNTTHIRTNPLKLLPAVLEHNTRVSNPQESVNAYDPISDDGSSASDAADSLQSITEVTSPSNVTSTSPPRQAAGVSGKADAAKKTSTLMRRSPRKPQILSASPQQAGNGTEVIVEVSRPNTATKTPKSRKDATPHTKSISEKASHVAAKRQSISNNSSAVAHRPEGISNEMTKVMQRRFEKLKRDAELINQAAGVDDVQDVWKDMVEKATKIYGNRDSHNLKHSRSQEIVELVHKQEKLYKKTRQSRLDPTHDADMQNLLTTTNELDQRIGFIHHESKGANKSTQGSSQAFSSNGSIDQVFLMDLYEHIIPALVLTSKTLLVTRYDEDKHAIDLGGYKEILRELSIIDKALRKAQVVKPRPKSVDSMLKNSMLIHSKIRVLRDVYNRKIDIVERQAKNATHQMQEERHTQTVSDEVDLKEIRARQRVEDERVYHQRIQERNRNIDRVRNYVQMFMDAGRLKPQRKMVHRTATAATRLASVVDIDDLEDSNDDYTQGQDISRGSPELGIDYPKAIRQDGLEMDSRAQREHTEDIPGPPHISWSTEETVALLNGLQQYNGEERFDCILETYGAEGEVLSSRDVYELILQAKFLKQSMLARLTSGLDRSWDWLRSVPD